MDPIAEWFVLGGDDTLPDPTHTPEDIAAQCSRYFGELHMLRSLGSTAKPGDPVSVETLKACIHGLQNSTMGVMQPTGDDWADQNGKIINRICGSPWIGREFAMRSYRGGGPLYSRYFHNWADQELFHVANRSGLLWQRPDLTHYHRHWNRPHGATREKDMPKWAPPIYSNNDWIYNGGLYKRREAQGFPGAEFLEED
jgi:hypothetical protein